MDCDLRILSHELVTIISSLEPGKVDQVKYILTSLNYLDIQWLGFWIILIYWVKLDWLIACLGGWYNLFFKVFFFKKTYQKHIFLIFNIIILKKKLNILI